MASDYGPPPKKTKIDLTDFYRETGHDETKPGDTQLQPKANDSVPICDQVIEDLKKRKEVGISRYGVALQANNGRNSLLDCYEEAQDQLLYLKQHLVESEQSKNINLSFINDIIKSYIEGLTFDYSNGDIDLIELTHKVEILSQLKETIKTFIKGVNLL